MSEPRSEAQGPPPSLTSRDTPVAMQPARAALHSALAHIAAAPETLREVVDASEAALLAFDADRRILCANAAAEALFGYDRRALDGQSTDILVAERMRQPDAPPMMPLADVMQVDLPGQKRDGTELAIEWSFASVGTATGPIFVMTVRDRASIDRAHEELRASEERFRLLVDSVRGYAIIMLDASGRMSSWNAGAERLKGWNSDDVLGESYELFFTQEDRASGLPQRLLDAAAREGSHEVTGWRVRKDGSRFRATALLTAVRSAGGELRGFAKITRDLTQQLRAEEFERLQRLQQATAALSEAATPQDVAAAVLEQCMLAFDAAGGAVYGLSADGKSLEELWRQGFPGAVAAHYACVSFELRSPLTDAARERKPSFHASFEEVAASYPSLREQLGWGNFEASAALPLVTHGELLGAFSIRFRDRRTFDNNDRSLMLTLSELCAQALERARLFAAERTARAEAEAANRSKDEFLAMLGHELRNPLAPMVTALQLIKLRDSSPPKEVTIIERQVTHLGRLVDDLLDVSRITRGRVELRRERIELSTVVTRAVELASAWLDERRQHLDVSVAREGLLLEGDATRLAQVVANLLSNAAKYTQPGGHVAITAARTANRIVLTVRDDGIGIGAQMLPRVFDLFVQEHQSSDRPVGGLGLGLAIVKTLVTQHDGKVSAYSEGHGKGSLFTVELPAAAPLDGALAAKPAAGIAPRAAGHGRRVLIVDDNTDAAEMLSDWLNGSGFDTLTAHDGPAAVETAQRFAPDVVLLDIGLPVMDGFEVARRIRKQSAEGAAPLLVAVTGYGQSADREKSAQEGFAAHMVKPIDLNALTAFLEGVQGRRA